jgi:lysozyme
MTRALLTDVSFYEDDPETPRHIDYVQMKRHAAGTIVRVGQRTWLDSTFVQSWNDAKKAGLPRGSYWFYDSRATPQGQAQMWFDILKNAGDFGELPLYADFEESYNGTYKGGANFKVFIETLQTLMPGKEIVIYTGYYYWKDNMPASLRPWFAQFDLWIAYYGNGEPYIPEPWTNWTFWQFSEDGDGDTYGTEGEVDLNWFNGTYEEFMKRFGLENWTPEPEPEPINNDQVIETHVGVKLHILERFGAKVWVHVIDPKIAAVQISGCGYSTPSFAKRVYDAQIVSNGGGWPDDQDKDHRSNEMWVSNGKFMQAPAYIKDNRPYLNITQDGILTISPNANVMPRIYNAVGFDRLLVINGAFNTAISDRVTKDARTASGITADGKLILLSCEGNDYYQRGLTLEEMAKIFIAFGAVAAGNNDGGSSSSIINTAISPDPLFMGSDGREAPVINHIMVFADPIGEPEEPEETMGTYQVVRSARFRSLPTTTTNDKGSSSEVGDTFESVAVQVDTHNSSITMVQHPNMKWLPLKIGSTEYTKLITTPVPEPEPTDDPYVSAIFTTKSGRTEQWVPVK